MLRYKRKKRQDDDDKYLKHIYYCDLDGKYKNEIFD